MSQTAKIIFSAFDYSRNLNNDVLVLAAKKTDNVEKRHLFYPDSQFFRLVLAVLIAYHIMPCADGLYYNHA